MTKEKKYRIVDSFLYKGKDGSVKDSRKWVRISPGEETPQLSIEERTRLLHEEKICEVDTYGENIRYKKVVHLEDKRVEELMGQDPRRIIHAIGKLNLSKESLEKLHSFAERIKMPKQITDRIDERLYR
jgi:hypothetical protein